VPSYSTGFCVAITKKLDGKRVEHAVNRHLALLHGLQQCGLGLRGVRLISVNQHYIRKKSARDKRKSSGLQVEDVGPDDIRRHKIGSNWMR